MLRSICINCRLMLPIARCVPMSASSDAGEVRACSAAFFCCRYKKEDSCCRAIASTAGLRLYRTSLPDVSELACRLSAGVRNSCAYIILL